MDSKFLTWATGKIKLSSTEVGMEALETSGNQAVSFGHVRWQFVIGSGQLMGSTAREGVLGCRHNTG